VLFFHSVGKAGVHIFSKSQRATIATMLRAELSGFEVPVEARGFSLLQKHPDQLWGSSSLLLDGYREFSTLHAFMACVWKIYLTF
jgi:hypothetical protein